MVVEPRPDTAPAVEGTSSTTVAAPKKVVRRLPEWFKVPMPAGENYSDLKKRMRGASLHTVCEEAACPNIGDCWDRRTASFMILGDTCTRACSYCNVKTGRPTETDWAEPFRLAQTIKSMGLKYAVITSVDRDDLEDAGSTIFEMTIKAVHKSSPGCKVEVLIPDFGGVRESLQRVVDARPEVLNHNIETVRRVFRKVRPAGDYDLSLELLKRAKEMNPEGVTKSGMMVGLGETMDEVLQTMEDLRANNCDLLTVGQYLRPSKKHHPIIRFYHPDEFEKIRIAGEAMGFNHVASGPLVRSSYHADEQHEASLASPSS